MILFPPTNLTPLELYTDNKDLVFFLGLWSVRF